SCSAWVTLSSHVVFLIHVSFFFSTAVTAVFYTLSLHDALPICFLRAFFLCTGFVGASFIDAGFVGTGFINIGLLPTRFLRFRQRDRKSTRLNSSHVKISYAVFCLNKKIKYDKLVFGQDR